MILQNPEIIVRGRLLKIARLRNEGYDFTDCPESECAKATALNADVFTFLERFPHGNSDLPYYRQPEPIAVLEMTTYEKWWKNQISDKTRNLARKAGKKGVQIRIVPFNDELIHGIMGIHNESPVRQGRRFLHYGKDFETTKQDHISYSDRSDFIGAFVQSEMIGFIKLVHRDGISNLMQIISKMAHRDKAPNNALLAKAVEICTQRNVPYLQYGSWSRGGLGEFKKQHDFRQVDRSRYFVPITLKGKLLLSLRLHRKWSDHLPHSIVERIVGLRNKWYSKRYNHSPG